MNGNESIDCCVSLHSVYMYTIYTLYICMYCELQLEVIYMQIDGAAELTHVPNNWSTFQKRPVPATLVWRGIKKNVAKAKWKLWNKYTKRAIRDLWQAFMATQIFVKCLPKYLFNQSRTGIVSIVYFKYILGTYFFIYLIIVKLRMYISNISLGLLYIRINQYWMYKKNCNKKLNKTASYKFVDYKQCKRNWKEGKKGYMPKIL